MCGILGIVAPRLPEAGAIKSALDALGHRGPDDEGYLFGQTHKGRLISASGGHSNPELKSRLPDVLDIEPGQFQVLLAHRRLSIIDVTTGGHQPFCTDDKKHWITYNGEVFNYRELGRELKECGYRFNTTCDTEVLLTAYREWGPEFTQRLNGQWALCIYDLDRNILFCSRDRFGIKPLYYWFDGTNFGFASEIKALLKLPFVKGKLSPESIADFVLWHRIDHKEESAFSGIHQLMPGHNAKFDLASGTLHKNTYYTPPYTSAMGHYNARKAQQYADDIRELFIDSVRLRLVSDVPVGSCLSGGLDSSSIVAVINMLQQSGDANTASISKRQKTFTATFEGSPVNEKPYAQAVIDHTGIDGYFTSPNGDLLWQEIDCCLFVHDGFCFGTNVYAGWKVMALAAEHVKVVLNGQGADEIFCGYPFYDPTYLIETLRQGRLNAMRNYVVGRARIDGLNSNFLRMVKDSVFASLPAAIKLMYLDKKMTLRLRSLFAQLGVQCSVNGFPFYQGKPPSGLNHHLWSDQVCSYLPMMLRYDDRNASAVSIENRVPFLDHRLVEYVNNIPAVYKVHNGWRKWLLRLAMRELLPATIIWRKEKNGFGTPHKQWMLQKNSPIPRLIQDWGIERYNQYWWTCFVAHRIVAANGVLDDLVA